MIKKTERNISKKKFTEVIPYDILANVNSAPIQRKDNSDLLLMGGDHLKKEEIKNDFKRKKSCYHAGICKN